MRTHGGRIRVLVTAAIVSAALLWWSGVSVATAQQVPPHVFVGIAEVDGRPAPDGATVSAWIGGAVVAEASVTNGSYLLLVAEPSGASFAGKDIVFKIGDLSASESARWELGGGDELHLSAKTPEPVPVEAAPVADVPPGHVDVNSESPESPATRGQAIRPVVPVFVSAPEVNQPTPSPTKTTPATPRARVDRPERRNDVPNNHRRQDIDRKPRRQIQNPEPEQERDTQESDDRETRRLERKALRELEKQNADRERNRAGQDAQVELERRRLDPQYPDLGVFRIDGDQDRDRKPDGSVSRRNRSSGRGFFVNSSSGASGAIDRILDPTSLAVIGILLTLAATSASLFKGN